MAKRQSRGQTRPGALAGLADRPWLIPANLEQLIAAVEGHLTHRHTSIVSWANDISSRFSRYIPNIPNIDKWFSQTASAELALLRLMSCKTKFSKNRKNVKARVQGIHARIGNARRDFLHKATTTISKNHAMVCVEDLPVRNLSKSAASSTEQPGRNVRAKSGLNQAILDQSWFEFRRERSNIGRNSRAALHSVKIEKTARALAKAN